VASPLLSAGSAAHIVASTVEESLWLTVLGWVTLIASLVFGGLLVTRGFTGTTREAGEYWMLRDDYRPVLLGIMRDGILVLLVSASIVASAPEGTLTLLISGVVFAGVFYWTESFLTDVEKRRYEQFLGRATFRFTPKHWDEIDRHICWSMEAYVDRYADSLYPAVVEDVRKRVSPPNATPEQPIAATEVFA
jgi:hypothetical protein